MACPHCSEPRIGPFCEQCGYSYSSSDAGSATGVCTLGTAVASSWCAVVVPDRDYFEAHDEYSGRFTFPASSPARRVELTGASVLIGKRSASRGITPGIDLAGPPVDPGVSREHARLLAQPDGSWALVDDGSTNGTYLNGSTTRIPVQRQVPVADGDRVHVGAWTMITLRRDS